MNISGYSWEFLQEHILSKNAIATMEHHEDRIKQLDERIDNFDKRIPVIIPFGENCAVGVKLRACDKMYMGGNFFDNIVCPFDSIIKLLAADFSDILRIKDLKVASWEGIDSVLNIEYNIFFHHYFAIPGHAKSTSFNGGRKRLIEPHDIPLFLPLVMSQFEYLIDKFKAIMSSDLKKVLVYREVNGRAISKKRLDLLVDSLNKYGAINYEVVVIHSDGDAYNFDNHYYIPRSDVRWGDKEHWAGFFGSLC